MCTILQNNNYGCRGIDTLFAYFTTERYFDECSIYFSASCQVYDGKVHGDFPFINGSPKEITTSIICMPKKIYSEGYNQSNPFDFYELYNNRVQNFFENMFLVEYENGYIPIDLNR